MKAYNQTWIHNRAIVTQAERWFRQALLSDAQITAIRQAYPVPFRQTNGFIEIGLFLFTTVAILACYLLPGSVFFGLLSESKVYGLFNVAFGIGVGFVGQTLINRRYLYRNGIDNAFVAMVAGFLAFGLNQFLPPALSTATHCLVTLPLLLLILWYYGDTLIGFFTIATFYTFVFDGLLRFSWGKLAMPFVMMAISGLLYVAISQFFKRFPKDVYYTDPLTMMQWLALIVLAASGNYYVVRELNGLLQNTRSAEAPEIALPALFWLLTFAIPTVYLWLGLSRKNRIFIILGIAGWIAAVITLHEYVALVPLNVALTIGGLVLIGIAIAGIQVLQQPKLGFTDVADDELPNDLLANMGTLASMHATTSTLQTPKNDLRFGDGNFGGGGSEGRY